MWKEKLWMSNPAAILGIAQSCVPEIVLFERPIDWEYAFNSDRSRERLYNFTYYVSDLMLKFAQEWTRALRITDN